MDLLCLCVLRGTRYLILSTLLMTFLATATLAAPPSNDVMVVEQDWSLTLNETADIKSSPQFVTASPLGPDRCFMITWNYHDFPNFVSGGVQMQAWDQDYVVTVNEISEYPLYVDHDTVTWTQVISISQQDCRLRITGINTQAWGTNINSSLMTFTGAGLANLNNFDSQSCVDESGIQYGHNRVNWFGVTEVRTYSDSGKLLSRDSTPKVVYQP
jgi:hypothetical protein